MPPKGAYLPLPTEPDSQNEKYHPPMPFFTALSARKRAEFEAQNRELYERDHTAWEDEMRLVQAENAERRRSYGEELDAWEQRRKAYLDRLSMTNAGIDAFEEKFKRGDPKAVRNFYELAIASIAVPVDFEREAYVDYDRDARNLMIEFYLPGVEQLPTLKAVTYVKSRNEFKESHQTAAFMRRVYEGLVYQLVIRVIRCVSTINETYDNVDSVVLNGRVKSVDPATGNQKDSCILSVSTDLGAFSEINLAAVDPKAWFRGVRGVSAAAIANVTPVKRIATMSREDRRFVDGYEVIGSVDEGTNVAAMDWQDFENLIRELFEEEFRSTGGEVKITQASRDGGVDAVSFDPDPLRGGKIVIQAKRYTNTVGISAVRDLYGTVMNEGATKGILVTTSGFGSDSYEFAKDKPLALISGGELLHLLGRHGHKAYINIAEARGARAASDEP